jgi:hypothetical protein
MSESSSDREIFGCAWAARICLAMIAGLAIITAVAIYNGNRLSTLEVTEENSAVGDKAFFPLPAEAGKSSGPAIQFNGTALYLPVPLKQHGERDSEMLRQGLDDSKKYSVYTLNKTSKSGKPVKPQDGSFYLKTGPAEYIKLSTTPAGT